MDGASLSAPRGGRVKAGPIAVDVRDAAELLGCSEWLVRQAIRRGEIPTLPLTGRRVLIPVDELRQRMNRDAQYGGRAS